MPLHVHVVGAHETNHPWGFENRLIPALTALGCDVRATDFRRNRSRLPELLEAPADLVLVCKGEGIPPEVIRDARAPTALWYAEQVGTANAADETAHSRREELALNVAAFDVVFSHDASNLDVYRALGARNIHALSSACVDPATYHPLQVAPRWDVTFVGSMTPRRQQLLEAIATHVPIAWSSEWDPVQQNLIYNTSRIVLNVHLSELPNTETRIAEVLGSGAFLLTEPLSWPDLFRPGEHLAVVEEASPAAWANAIRRFLRDGEARATIARAGHAHARAHHTFTRRAATLLEIALPGYAASEAQPRVA